MRLRILAVFVTWICVWEAALQGAGLGLDGARFTVDGEPVFLLGASYYGGLGASEETVRTDMDALRQAGFNWVRVWATWSHGGDVSAVGEDGGAREPYLTRLKALVRACDERGMVVDVTLTRGKSGGGGVVCDLAAHRAAVEVIVVALGEWRNWYLDLANERDVRDARYVSAGEVRELRELVRRLDPDLLVTASFGGHDLGKAYVREALVEAGLDFVAPHRPREAGSPGETESHTRICLEAMSRLGIVRPVHYQEPFRRGYGRWQPEVADYLEDLAGAVRGRGAGWCLHNGSSRSDEGGVRERSFDLRGRSLMSQLDAVELEVVRRAAEVVGVSAKREALSAER